MGSGIEVRISRREGSFSFVISYLQPLPHDSYQIFLARVMRLVPAAVSCASSSPHVERPLSSDS